MCGPRDIIWQEGVDFLYLGRTTNGTAMGYIVIFFNNELAREFDYRAKQAGQLASKMRFLAAPWVGLLNNNVWLENARRANKHARLLSERLAAEVGLNPAFPCEASAVFPRMSDQLVQRLHDRGWHF